MKKPLFTGACTALVTPFAGDEVNFPMLEALIRRQIQGGIRALVLCGTTGEAATLSDEEKLAVFRCGKYVEGSLIIAGTGSNSTAHAVELSRRAQDCGVDGLLVVSPYYNKATPAGLTAHYRAIAQAVRIPILLYNVPSRTGVDIPVSVYRELSELPNIIGVKEASTDLGKIAQIRRECPEDFHIWCGSDALTVPIMSLGGKGVISVASNLCPEKMQALCRAALEGDFPGAATLQLELLDLMEALFLEVNPIPVKAAMKLLGYDCGSCRLPLTGLSPAHLDTLREALADH